MIYPHVKRRLSWWIGDSSAYDQSENLDLDTIGLTFLLNGLAGLTFLVIFGKLRQRTTHPYSFSTRRLHLPKQTPPDLPKSSIFSWVMPCMAFNFDEILYYAGLDALMYIRFHWLGLRIFGIFAVYGLCVLIPVNALGSNGEQSLFNTLTLSNIADGSNTMWFHVVGMYLLTAITMWQLVVEFRTYTRLRHEFLRRRRALFRSVLVEEVPRPLRSQATLRAYFEKLYPGQVVEVFLCQRLEALTRLIEQRESVLAKLEHAMVHQQRFGKTTYVWRGWGHKEEAVTYWQARLHELNDEVSREQARRLRFARQANRRHVAEAAERMEGMLRRLRFDPRHGDVYAGLTDDDLVSETSGDDDSYQMGGYGSMGLSNGNGRPKPPGAGGDEEQGRPKLSPAPGGLVPAVGGEGAGEGEPGAAAAAAADAGGRASPSGTLQEQVVAGLKRNPLRVAQAGLERALTAMGLMGDIYGPDEANEMEALLQKHTQRDQHRMASKAFITFKSFTPATIARQVMHSANPGYMKLSEAPEPSDIHWENINMNSRKAKVRHYFGVVLYILIVIGYVIPVTLISDVTSETYLRDQYAWIDSICSNTIVASAVDLIQPCSLLMLMITIPPIFRLMGFMEGHMTESAINNQMLSRYYTFLIVNVLLVVSLAGSVVTSIDEIVTDPVAFFESLGTELPKVAGYFTDYVLIKAFSGQTLEISRFTSWLMHQSRRLIWWDLTPRDRRAVVLGLRDFLDPGWFPYGKYIAQDLLSMSIIMTYAVMAPLILIPALLFYSISLLIYRYMLLYIYVPVYESGGQMFPKVFRRWVFGLFIGQAVLVGVFLTKSGYNECYAVLALFFITYYFKSKMRSMWEPVALSMPLELTEFLDRQPLDPIEDRVMEAERYIQPALAAPPLASPEIE